MRTLIQQVVGWTLLSPGGKEACVGVAAKDCVEAAICNPIWYPTYVTAMFETAVSQICRGHSQMTSVERGREGGALILMQ